MKIFRSVLHYTTGRTNIEVYFPEEEVACINCRFCQYEQGADRYFCRLLPERPQIYTPRMCIEGFCPLKFEGEETISEDCSESPQAKGNRGRSRKN